MLLQSALNFDIQLHMLDPDPAAPCAKIAHSFTCGSLQDYDTVLQFGQDKDLLTVEIENVNTDALAVLEAKGVNVFPQPHVLNTIRDKGLQKQFYTAHGIPTAPYQLFENKAELQHVPFPFVQKLRTGGYDGKGVQVIRTEADLDLAFDAPCVVEQLIPFEKELSVIVARRTNGEIKSFPVVECEFNPEANLVEFLFSPAILIPEIEAEAQRLAQLVIEELDMVGLLAVEFFLTTDGTLLINEIAPRPHNSGHHTIESCVCSQFEQHLRAILDLPLAPTDLIQAGAMLNLTGEKGFEGPVIYEGLEAALAIPGVHPHLYGKATTKAFRKMGHLTITGPDLQTVRERAAQVKSLIRVIA
jgi:5-(carboxyamino)imidazole ribonucleotide synthase